MMRGQFPLANNTGTVLGLAGGDVDIGIELVVPTRYCRDVVVH